MTKEENLISIKENLIKSKKIDSFCVWLDANNKHFFFIIRKEADAIKINNTTYEEYISFYDYETNKIIEKNVIHIKNMLKNKNFHFICKCQSKEQCIKLIQYLNKNYCFK